MHNYCQGAEIEIRTLAHNPDGTLDLDALKEAAGSCGVYLEQPNPLGVLDEGLTTVKSIVGDHTALIVGVQPVSLGVVCIGHYGADIVVGEGQPLGSPVPAAVRCTVSLPAPNRTCDSCPAASSVAASTPMGRRLTASRFQP